MIAYHPTFFRFKKKNIVTDTRRLGALRLDNCRGKFTFGKESAKVSDGVKTV